MGVSTNCMVVDCSGHNLKAYVTYEPFAKVYNPQTYYSDRYRGWYLKELA